MAIRRAEVLAILHHIQQGGADVHTLTNVGKESLLSPDHARRVFRCSFGESPKRFSHRLRMERAAALLAHSNRPVGTVAVSVGFETHEGFTRAFRAYCGESPRAFRARSRSAPSESEEAVCHAYAIGPCVRLYRRPNVFWRGNAISDRRRFRKEEELQYDIDRQERSPQPSLVIERRISPGDVADTLAEVLPRVFEHAMTNGLSIVGTPFVIYSDWSAGGVTVNAGLPVEHAGRGTDEIRPHTTLGGTYACTVHSGAYDTLNEAHEALERWITEQGLRPGPASYEFYLTDPDQYPDEDDWRTEVLREIIG